MIDLRKFDKDAGVINDDFDWRIGVFLRKQPPKLERIEKESREK